ncbi:hypothetical protein 2 [Wenzhou tombus-like virus 14]|uniref:hypothetical protein 2 n=1 Tax=Wenzhou tombus-like virus 14 TaxID=1923667 RepID=UPI00090B871D|nr:hypothetical protein 2 [Wenzhou tombus-like virus 14]APG76637.1 hypothetical protein 2 [Wenzhou tombus-like virus 14]
MEETRAKIRSRYHRAYLTLKSGKKWLFDKSLAKVKSFVKFEKMSMEAYDERKPARLIQHRSYEYLYLLKKYMFPLSKALKNCTTKLDTGQPINTIFASGLNSKQLGERIHQMFTQFPNCVALCLDHSKWDGHFNKELMELAHNFWKTLINHLKRFVKMVITLLVMQKKNYATTQHLLNYIFDAIRCSGEWTTAIENSKVNYTILKAVFPSAWILVNGDDSIVFIDRSEFNKLNIADILQEFKIFGQETKLDRVATCMEEISFCQCSPINFGEYYKMVRDPIRAMSRAAYTSIEMTKDLLPRYLSGLGLCELSANSGVPILQSFALHLITKGDSSSPTTAVDRYPYAFEEDLRVIDVSYQTRHSFELAFGMSIPEQLEYERMFQHNVSSSYLEKFKHFHQAERVGW